MAVRWWTAPLPEIAAEVPRAGTVLDVGCGHGLLDLYLADAAPARLVHGVEIDEAKLRSASTAARRARLADRVTFEAVTPSWSPAGCWDAVVVVDVLYLLGAGSAARLVTRLARSLAPGGRLLIKEMAASPAWKHRWSEAQERLARGSGLTMGTTLDHVTPYHLRPVMEAAGLQVAEHRLDRGYAHPHTLLVGVRPTDTEHDRVPS